MANGLRMTVLLHHYGRDYTTGWLSWINCAIVFPSSWTAFTTTLLWAPWFLRLPHHWWLSPKMAPETIHSDKEAAAANSTKSNSNTICRLLDKNNRKQQPNCTADNTHPLLLCQTHSHCLPWWMPTAGSTDGTSSRTIAYDLRIPRYRYRLVWTSRYLDSKRWSSKIPSSRYCMIKLPTWSTSDIWFLITKLDSKYMLAEFHEQWKLSKVRIS